jgi:hypothetical protein
VKTSFPLLVLLIIAGSGYSSRWINFHSSQPVPVEIRLVASSILRSTIRFSFDGFSLREALTPCGTAYVVDPGKFCTIPDIKMYGSWKSVLMRKSVASNP